MEFKKPIKKTYLGKAKHGCPYFYPSGYVSSIIKVYNKKPMVRRAKYIVLGKYHILIGSPIKWGRIELGWKDKYGSPRFEWCPQLYIYFFGFEYHIWWTAPDGNNDAYYDQWLWTYKYCDGDIKKARESWGWVDMETKRSTWEEGYIRLKP